MELNPADGQILKTVSYPMYPPISTAFAFDGIRLYLGQGDQIYKINPEDGHVDGNISIGSNISGLACSGGYVYAFSDSDSIRAAI